MTKIKLCGITRTEDVREINKIKPEYIGFVFAKKSKRYISPERASELKKILDNDIKAVGVFVNEPLESVAKLLKEHVIDLAQLHGNEDEAYISRLKKMTDAPVIKAFCITGRDEMKQIKESSADYVLLDSGAGSGQTFEWDIVKEISRPFFLAGGLDVDNVEKALREVKPFAVDVSSGIETDGVKDSNKMAVFAAKVREY